LGAFVAEVETHEIAAEPDLAVQSARDQVQVMTLQRAKGRVWPVVIVTGVHQDAWPSGNGSAGLFGLERLTADQLLPDPVVSASSDRQVLNFALSRATHSLTFMAAGGDDSPPLRMLTEMQVPMRTVSREESAPHNLSAVLSALRSGCASSYVFQ